MADMTRASQTQFRLASVSVIVACVTTGYKKQINKQTNKKSWERASHVPDLMTRGVGELL